MSRRALRTFIRSKTGVLGGILVTCFFLAAVFAPHLAPYDPDILIDGHESLAPCAEHWLGTTPLGEDMASRILHGARTSLEVGIVSVGISAMVGLLIGLLAGYRGGWIDTSIMRMVDILMAFPSILLAITIVSILGRSLNSIMIAVGVVGIPVFARQVRASVLAVRELEYVSASRALGASPLRIVLRHILPATLGPVVVLITLRIATALLESAGLSFLGLGGEAVLEWGNMLAENKDHFSRLPHLVLAPGLAISLTVLAFNLFGDALRDALDPRLHR